MVRVVSSPRIIQAAGYPPKEIAEFIGREVSGTIPVSIAMMKSPPGWSEPGQTPDFDEYSLVLSGTLIITTRTGDIRIKSGNAAIVQAGEWVRYQSPEGAEYFAVCLPAFSTDLVHRDDDTQSRSSGGGEKGLNILYEEYGKEGLMLIEELWNQLREHHASHARYFQEHILARSFSQRRDEILKGNEGREILVHLARTQDSGKYIGFCVSSAAPGDYGEIESIYIDPLFRMKGIGTTFMTRSCAWLKDTGVIEYRVGVCEGNEDSFRFYERFGFYVRRHILIRRD